MAAVQRASPISLIVGSASPPPHLCWHLTWPFCMCYWILLTPSRLITSFSTKVVEGFTLFITVNWQPMQTNKRNHKTSNCTMQPCVLIPHYKKIKSQCNCCSEGLKTASSELAHPSARLELQIKIKYNFTRSKEERNTWGIQINLKRQVMNRISGVETCKDIGDTEDNSQTVP